MRPILLATDGSPSAVEAQRETIELARALRTSVVAVAVSHVEPPVRPQRGYPELLEKLATLEHRRIGEALAQTAAAVRAAGIECETLDGAGPVVDEIFLAARTCDARMIVVGSHGWGPVRRAVKGSISSDLLDGPPCPVLVVHGESRPHTAREGGVMKPVMLATDGSLSAEAATEEAIELARAFGAPLVVVCVAHVSAAPYGAAYIGYGELYTELRKAEADHVDQVLTDTRERATAAGVDCTTVALEGLPGEEICREAEAHGPRLVVIGAHGWGHIGRLVHGSVSTHVLHHASCPVLVVHGEGGGPQDRVTAETTGVAS